MLSRPHNLLIDNLKADGVSFRFTVNQMQVSPEGVTFFRCDMGGVYAVCDHDQANPVCMINPTRNSSPGLALSKEGILFAYDALRSEIVIFPKAAANVKYNQAQIESLRVPTNSGVGLTITPDQKYLLSYGNSFQIWAIENNKIVPIQSFEDVHIISIAVSPRGQIATLNYQGKYCVYHYIKSNFTSDILIKVGEYQDHTLTNPRMLSFNVDESLFIGYSGAMVIYNSINPEMKRKIHLKEGLRKFILSHQRCYLLNSYCVVETREISETIALLSKLNADEVGDIFMPTGNELYYRKFHTLYAKIMHTVKFVAQPASKPSFTLTLEDNISKHADYIVKNFYHKPFANGSLRYTHGALHACSAAIYGMMLINLRQRRRCPLVKDLDAREIKLIQIAILFHDAGRQADGVDYWDRDSALLGYQYVRNVLRLNEQDAWFVADAIANKDSYDSNWCLEDGKTWNLSGRYSKFIRNSHHVITHDADCVENKRTKQGWHDSYLDYVNMFLVDENFKEPSDARKDLMCFLNEIDVFMFHAGSSVNYRNEVMRQYFNSRVDCYDALLELMKQLKLNNLIALYADGKMLTPTEANALSLTTTAIQQQPFFFKKFISNRHDYDLADLLLSFTRSPFNVERRALRCERDATVHYSLRGQRDVEPGTIQYAIHQIETPEAKPMYTREEKKHHSKATALCYSDPRYGFAPTPYKDETSDEIGLIFPPESVLLNRLFYYSGNMSTYYRFYEQFSDCDIEKLYHNLKENNKIFHSLEQLVKLGRNNKGYQILGRIAFMAGIKVCLFTDLSNNAKLKAELAVTLLEMRINEWAKENKTTLPENITIPIIYYMPGHSLHLTTYSGNRFDTLFQEARHRLGSKLCLMKPLHELHIRAAHNELTETLDHHPTVDPTDNKRRTPLFYAAQNGHVKAMYFLIAAGADISKTDGERRIFIDMLFKLCLFEAYKELLDMLKDEQPTKQTAVHALLFSDYRRSQAWKVKIKRYVQDKPLLDWYGSEFNPVVSGQRKSPTQP